MSKRLDRIRLRYRGALYRFLAYEFRDHQDGSFNVILDRQHLSNKILHWDPTSERFDPEKLQKDDKFRADYHTSGRLNFHGVKSNVIFYDPIYDIKRPSFISCLSIPSVTVLTPLAQGAESKFVLQIPDETEGRISFDLSICPYGTGVSDGSTPEVLLNYAPWFSLSLRPVTLPIELPAEAAAHIIHLTPSVGFFENQVVSRGEAFLEFQRRRSGSDPIRYWNPDRSEYRMILPTSVPMRIVPNALIHFVDAEIEARNIVVKQVPGVAAYDLTFRAFRKGSQLVTQPAAVAEIAFDARL